MKTMKRPVKIILCVLLTLLLIAAAYFVYVLVSYYRIGDQELSVTEVNTPAAEQIGTATPYHLVSWNIGFGAYEADYDFFMDGGTQSWAWSRERLTENLSGIASFIAVQNADLLFVQEVDIDGTRSYHVNEQDYVTSCFCAGSNPCSFVTAQNYDSPFLFYPFTQPHGASVSGLLTMSPFTITQSERVELPIENTMMKFLDLDRCYCKNRIPVENGKELVLYNFHLSAYTSDGTIANEQLKIILDDMQAEYDKGNYCIAGGDFNKDLLGGSEAVFGKADKEYSWAQPIPEGMFDGYAVTLVAPFDASDPVPSCRNADGPYHEGQYVLTVDGFMVSDNVKVESSKVLDIGFAYSDHNPVEMRFTCR